MSGRADEARQGLRVFLSSPGDVSDERGLALSVIDRLRYDPFIREHVLLDTVAWDNPVAGIPILANAPRLHH